MHAMNISTQFDFGLIFQQFLCYILSIIVEWWYLMLKYRRKKLGISQLELSERLNITQSHLSKIENRKFSNVNIDLIKKISKELKLDPVDVFYFFYDTY